MMLAAKHFDPVLGIDIHIIQPPGPVPPVPIPHPFVGFIMDPFDYLPIIGATVFVNGIPRAIAGTAGRAMPPHIPIGGVFVKPPANECEMFMGSATVSADGDAMSHMVHPALSCHCIGMVAPFRPKKKGKIKSLVLPTSVVLPIPLGAPVTVGGPPTISLMALGMRLGMSLLGKAFKKLRKARKAKKAKGANKAAKNKRFKKNKKGKAASNKSSCEAGCPVDAVTGSVVDRMTDYFHAGQIPFVWQKHYDSSWKTIDSPLGRGWRHDYQRTLAHTGNSFLYSDGNGEQFEFPPIDTATRSSDWAGFRLTEVGEGRYHVHRHGQPTMEFQGITPSREMPLFALRDGSCSAVCSYDRNGRLSAIFFDDDRHVRFRHDSNDRITTVELVANSKSSVVARYRYDQNGNQVSARDALGNQSKFEYDAENRLTCKQDALGYCIRYQYNSDGRCTRTWGQDGLYDEHFEYHPNERRTVRICGDGGRWTYEFDEDGTATSIVDPYGGRRSFVLDELGRIVFDIDESGLSTELLYDDRGEHYARRTPSGHIQPPRHVDLHPPEPPLIEIPKTPAEWQWGRLVSTAKIASMQNESAEFERSAFDAMGRVIERSYSGAVRERWQYDANGNVIAHEDKDGSISQIEIDSWNLVRSRTDGIGARTVYQYNIHEYVTRISDPHGATSEYKYDLKDRIVEVHRHGELKESYSWDAAGNLTEKRDATDSPILNIEIGDRGLPVRWILASGDVHSMEYDNRGRVVRASTDSTEVSFEYDAYGRLKSDMQNERGVSHNYLFGFPIKTVALQNFATTRAKVGKGKIEILDPLGVRHVLDFSSADSVNRSRTGGTEESCRYNKLGQQLSRIVRRINGNIESTEWRYSPFGSLQSRRDANGTTTWEYDAAHRLVSQTNPNGNRSEFVYDGAGNLISKPGLRGVSILEGNRLQSANDCEFEYNDRNHVAKRTSSDGSTRYTYDSKDMLVRADVNGEPWSAGYDALGRRTSKVWRDQSNYFYWDGNRLAAERCDGRSLRVYTYPDENALVPIGFTDFRETPDGYREGASYDIYSDQRGCPEWVEDQNGKVVWRADIDAYGVAHVADESCIELNIRMPGHYSDTETGLHYNRFRYYDPALGRYIQSDPIGQAGGVNLYAYTPSPLTSVDILGWSHSNDLGGSKTSPNAESPVAKPSTSGPWRQTPNVKNWIDNGGKVEPIASGPNAGGLKYTNKDGISVEYNKDGFPDFTPHAEHKVDIGTQKGDRGGSDYKAANEKIGHPEYGKKSPPGCRWHHHEDCKTMLAVPTDIHSEFSHAGGVSEISG